MATAKSGTSASAETPIHFLQNFRSETVASADSLQRKTPWSAVYGLATRDLYAYDVHAAKMRARQPLTSSILRTVCTTVHFTRIFRQSRSWPCFMCDHTHVVSLERHQARCRRTSSPKRNPSACVTGPLRFSDCCIGQLGVFVTLRLLN